MDLTSYTLPQLQQLSVDIANAIQARRIEERKQTLAHIRELAASRGYSLAELKRELAGAPRGKVAAKFVNPANPMQTWTGRGRNPAWVKEHLAASGTLDQLKIAA